MPAQAQDREHLGRLLVGRRVEIDSKYRNRRTFAAERGIEYHLAYRVERGAQPTFEEATKAVIEKAYGLASGSFDRSLATGKLELADTGDGQQPESRAELERRILASRAARVESWRAVVEHAQAELSEALADLAEAERAFAAGDQGRKSGPRAI